MRVTLIAASLFAFAAAPAGAEIVRAAPDGFSLHFEAESELDRDAAWARLIDISAWWSSDHTYSGDAANLSLDMRPGGCWCESWDGGAVEHGRVLLIQNGEAIRFEAPLGPLQGMGVAAVITFTLSDAESGGTAFEADFIAAGTSVADVGLMAEPVNGVFGAAFSSLTGAPLPAEASDAPETPGE